MSKIWSYFWSWWYRNKYLRRDYNWFFSTIGEDGKPVILITKGSWNMCISQRELPKLIKVLGKIKNEIK